MSTLRSPPPAPRPPAPAALAVATRGGTVESVHYGAAVVVDRRGRILYAAGDPALLTFTRSTLKPFQAAPFVAAGGLERYGYGAPETALLSASHSGEPRHVATAAAMLERAGNRAEDLQCGTHAPLYYETMGELPPSPPYSALAHNCSGKHAGMLAYCRLCDWPTKSYLARDHPAQAAIRAAVAHFLDVPESTLVCGTDGCSAPNYAAPLASLAGAYARLADPDEDRIYGHAHRRLADAMSAHPDMVSGVGRHDLALMTAGRGDWITKVGAEGVQALGLRSAGLGIAIKIVDGAKRALMPATVAVLEQLGLLDAEQKRCLESWRVPPLTNARGIVTGRVEPVVALASVEKFALDQGCRS